VNLSTVQPIARLDYGCSCGPVSADGCSEGGCRRLGQGGVVAWYPAPREIVDALSAAYPENCFYTSAYCIAQQMIGARLCVFEVGSAGCTAFVREGRLHRSLYIPSVPHLDNGAAAVFCAGVREFCRRNRISHAFLESYGSTSSNLSTFEEQVQWRERGEFVVYLDPGMQEIASNHHRNVRKARRAGLALHRSRDWSAGAAHLELVAASLQRRQTRGESAVYLRDHHELKSYLDSGAGELFQVFDSGEIRSSLLVLKSSSGAYYQSAGTTPAGMQQGASHFLVHEAATALRAEGVKVFNLGGASADSPGLRRFKEGFGSSTVRLSSVRLDFRRPVLRSLEAAARKSWRYARRISQALIKVERFVVYTADTRGGLFSSSTLPRYTVERMTDAELCDLRSDPELGIHADRFATHGYNGAYVVRLNGDVAHINWLIPHEEDKRRPRRDVRLRPGEAEITHGYTRRRFRGRGLQPAAILSLCGEAATLGIVRVFSITSRSNPASLRGISKAGMVPAGTIVRASFGQGMSSITVRLFRMSTAWWSSKAPVP
jgi:hypothetical protein